MSDRLVDIPIESLPLIDEHEVEIEAPQARVWEALLEHVAAAGRGRGARLVSRALGCRQTQAAGKPGAIGSTIPGFIVTRAIEPAVLALMGEHRWSDYALIFRLEPAARSAGATRLVAETRAVFPGRSGAVYRLLVIGARGHVVAARGILGAVRRRAERG